LKVSIRSLEFLDSCLGLNCAADLVDERETVESEACTGRHSVRCAWRGSGALGFAVSSGWLLPSEAMQIAHPSSRNSIPPVKSELAFCTRTANLLTGVGPCALSPHQNSGLLSGDHRAGNVARLDA